MTHVDSDSHISAAFLATVEKYPDRTASRIRAEESLTGWGRKDGIWLVQTWSEVAEKVNLIARGLVDQGVQHGDRVALFVNNCPEWQQIDFAILSVGAVTVPLYATSTVDQIRHIVNDSGAVLMFCGDAEAERVSEAKEGTTLREIISLKRTNEGFPTIAEFIAGVSPESQSELEARRELWSPEDLFSLIYTSGTTGEPRGVMLQHKAPMAQNEALSDVFKNITVEDHSLAFLPLSHALERAWNIYCMSKGCMTTYCPDARLVAELMVLAQPTMIVSVPRLYEKVASTAKGKVVDSPLKSKIFTWALQVGGQMQHANRKGKNPRLWWRAQFPIADKLVFSAVREAMGGTKTVLACGGAPLRKDVEEFFSAIGLPIVPGYGLTEAGPLVSFNRPTAFKVGSAGQVMKNGQLRIHEESEILYRGPNVMKGYWNNPEATEEAFLPALPDDENQDPWLRTGDAGYIDNDDFLVITDRLKDIIITSGGKNISPQAIEGLILSNPLFEQAVLLGDARPYVTLLVKPSMEGLSELAEKLQLTGKSISEQMSDPKLVEEVRRQAMAMTSKLPSHEQFKDMRVLLEDFTMENGLLTPTLKVRRREVERRFAGTIEEMYAKVVGFKDRVVETYEEAVQAWHNNDDTDEEAVNSVETENVETQAEEPEVASQE